MSGATLVDTQGECAEGLILRILLDLVVPACHLHVSSVWSRGLAEKALHKFLVGLLYKRVHRLSL